MSDAGSYHWTPEERERLRTQAAVLGDRGEALIRATLDDGQGEALAVGGGPGFFAARVRGLFADLVVDGVDVEAESLQAGLEAGHYRQIHLRLRGRPLPVETDRYDLAWARLVLRHLDDQEAEVAELVRVVKPGGRVLLIDADDEGSLVLQPEPEPLQRFRRALAREIGPVRVRMGRHLPALLARAGCEEIRGGVATLSTLEHGIPVFCGVLGGLLSIADRLQPVLGAELEEAMALWSAQPGALGMWSLVYAAGTVR